jgi:GntR family transcriptional repressor for pyruvate dehydrogenase complex
MSRRLKRSERVAAGIKQLIIDEKLRPGDRLPTEKEIADRFGVSRVSVREATKALGFLGIIRAAPRRGLSLGEVDMGRVTEYLGFHLALNGYSKKQLWQSRYVIEEGALPYVVQAIAADAAVFDNLQSLVERTRNCADSKLRMQADMLFHRSLLEASGIGPLVAFSDLLQIFFDRMRNPNPPPSQWDKTVRQHVLLIESLRAGDLRAARRILRRHFDEYANQLAD